MKNHTSYRQTSAPDNEAPEVFPRDLFSAMVVVVDREQPGFSSVQLYIGVRYFSSEPEKVGPMDIDVTIDGKQVVRGRSFPTTFDAKSPDYVMVYLRKNNARFPKHVLYASLHGRVIFRQQFTVQKDHHWVQLNYNYVPADHPQFGKIPMFEFEIRDRDFGWR